MSWTYDPALAEAKDQVRFLIQDVTVTKQLFQDEEIDWAITHDANIFLAAANLCDLLVGRMRGVKFKKISEFSMAFSPDYYMRLSGSLRARGMFHQIPYVGGISKADKLAQELRDDWAPPAISRGQGDNPAAPSPAVAKDPLTTI